MIAKTMKATLKRASSSVSMEMEIDPPKKPEVGAEAINDDDFFNAAENGDSSFFEALSHDQLLKALSLRNEDCSSLLHVAASSAHPKVVKILSAIDPSVTGINSADEEGWAPLHSASSSGNLEIVEILLSSGANVNLKNNGGRTALHYAASKGWLKIAEILLSHGANINLKDKVGCTPLHRAASTGNSELYELLIEEGAEVDAIDKTGQTPLMSAVICENKESPQQPTNVECGFYVMRYVKDLIGDQSNLRKQNFNGKKTYTEIELDEVRVEWINFVLKNMS
ncbi:26S proteasome non-ATPase regulatory subunit 10 [Camellia lanceoleosa]|uniref:26S proteasome non-ATPase regulatory subunit 10 n=1 Tax=Camellia lanceoleosa TaxID=1840588 RepID=A0ACC0HBJ9_9ERIC|nr:26S proteasome non-ATPase regulatory subunit 10 [Camellia lanceoleosa]